MIELIGGDLYQWDTGRRLKITPENGENIHEVHITSKGMSIAYVLNTQPEDDYLFVPIPNKILQQFRSLQCYEVIENDNGEQSISETTFAINRRNRPEDYVYTEEEKYNYKTLAVKSELAIKNANEYLSKLALVSESIETYTRDLIFQLDLSNIENKNGIDSILYSDLLPIADLSELTDYDDMTHGEIVFSISKFTRYSGVSPITSTDGGKYKFSGTGMREISNGKTVVYGDLNAMFLLAYSVAIMLHVEAEDSPRLRLYCKDSDAYTMLSNARVKGTIDFYKVRKNVPYDVANALDALNGEVI